MNKADKAEIKAMVSGLFADMKNDIVNDIRGNGRTEASKANKKASKANKAQKGPKVFKNKWDKDVSHCDDCGRNHIVGSAPYEACFGKATKVAPKAPKPNKASKPKASKASKPKASKPKAPKPKGKGKKENNYKTLYLGDAHAMYSDGKILRRPAVVINKNKDKTRLLLNLAIVRPDGSPAKAINADLIEMAEFIDELRNEGYDI